MSTSTRADRPTQESGAAAQVPADEGRRGGQSSSPLGAVADLLRNVSAIPLLVVLVVVFSLWVPETFLTSTTWLSLFNGNATIALGAIAVTLALAAGAFDVSIGTTIGFGAMSSAYLITHIDGSPVIAVLICLGLGLLVGVVNGLLVVVIGVDSFIATLGVSSVLTALVLGISNGQQIIIDSVGFANLGGEWALGLSGSVFVLAVVAVASWYVLQCTPIGRRTYATGGNQEAARLAGVRTKSVVFGSLVASAIIGTITGILIAAQYGLGDPSSGPNYLLPSFAAAFLGSTQFGKGRFNIWGTLLAVFVLAVGVKGLQLVGVSFWVPSLFNGVALLAAVSLARLRSNRPADAS